MNAAILAAAILFVRSRGGFNYLKTKYRHVFHKEHFDAANARLIANRVDCIVNSSGKPQDIYFLGDSIVEYGFWHDGLDKVVNYGIGGQTSSELAKWCPRMKDHNPSAIILLVGINNFKAGVTAELISTYLEDIKKIRSCFSENSQYIVLGILPVNEDMAKEFIACQNIELRDINSKLQNLCANIPNTTFVDVSNELVDNAKQLNSQFTVDGVHLSHQGYKTLTESLKKSTGLL